MDDFGTCVHSIFRLLVAPVRVTGDYDFNSIPLARFADWDAWVGLALILGCLLVAALFVRTRPAVTIGILFFFITLLPVSNWIVLLVCSWRKGFCIRLLLDSHFLAAWPGRRFQTTFAAADRGRSSDDRAILCISHNYIWQDTLTFHDNAVRVIPSNAAHDSAMVLRFCA